MLKKYLKSIKENDEFDELFDGSTGHGLHMATNTTELYSIHRDYFCSIRRNWCQDING